MRGVRVKMLESRKIVQGNHSLVPVLTLDSSILILNSNILTLFCDFLNLLLT